MTRVFPLGISTEVSILRVKNEFTSFSTPPTLLKMEGPSRRMACWTFNSTKSSAVMRGVTSKPTVRFVYEICEPPVVLAVLALTFTMGNMRPTSIVAF